MSEPDIRTILGDKPTFSEGLAIEFHREHPDTDVMKCIKVARKATEEWSATTGIKTTLEKYIKDCLLVETVKGMTREDSEQRRGRGIKIPEDIREAVRIDAANGKAISDIAREYGIGKTSVKRIISEYNYLVSAKIQKEKKEPLKMEYISHFETEEPPCDVLMPPPEEDQEGVYRAGFFENPAPGEREPLPEADDYPEPQKKKSLVEILVEMGEAATKMFGLPATGPCVPDSDVPEDDGADMFMMLSDLREFIEEHFGEHIPYDMCCDNKVGMAQYHFRETRSGKAYRISIYETTEEEQDEVEEDDYDE